MPSEIPLEEYPQPSAFIEEALECVRDAQEEGITLRVMGGLGIYLHCHSTEHKQLAQKLGRLGQRVFTDIDFVTYSRLREKVLKFFTKRGYDVNPRFKQHYFYQRCIFFGGNVPIAEVFFDKLEMNHTIDLSRRLEADNPTISLADLLLAKLQMVKIDEKDLKDVVLMLASHDLGETDKETVNLKRLSEAGLLSNWGFYYTVASNLRRIQTFAEQNRALTEHQLKTVQDKAERILCYLEQGPKTMSWQLRAKLGTTKKWYNDVEDGA